MRLAERSVLVLTSLAGGDRHGYALIKDIESFSGVQLSPGTLYGSLASLEADGYVERLPADDRRYPYRLTPAGRTALAQRLAESARITNVGLERIALGAPDADWFLMRRLLHATLLLYPRNIRRRHGAELETLVEELIERDGRARPAVMGRLAVDGLTQRLSSRATLWAVTITLLVTSAGGLAVSDFAAASAHQRPVAVHRSHRAHRTSRRSIE